MDPNDIWAVPPLCTVGDEDIDLLYASVGRSLTRWEQLEANLSLMFAYIIEPKEGSEEARRAYGSIATFRGRAEMLLAAAAVRFAADTGPVHGDIKSLVNLLTSRASARRNEIAHGVVQYTDPAGTRRYLLVPPWYATAKRRLPNSPTYAYDAATVNRFGKQFEDLMPKVWRIHEAVQQ